MNRVDEQLVLLFFIDRTMNHYTLFFFMLGNRPRQGMRAIQQREPDPVADFLPPDVKSAPDTVDIPFVITRLVHCLDRGAQNRQVLQRQQALQFGDIQAGKPYLVKKFHTFLLLRLL